MNHNLWFEIVIGFNKAKTVTTPALNYQSLSGENLCYPGEAFAILAFRAGLPELRITPAVECCWESAWSRYMFLLVSHQSPPSSCSCIFSAHSNVSQQSLPHKIYCSSEPLVKS